MDDLEVNNQLTATIVDDERTDTAAAFGEGIADPLEEVALGDDGETLLDITGLGHGDDLAIVTEVQDAVGLVDGTQHGLDNNRGRRVGYEARLLLQLAGEEVNTEVAVLASLGRDGDTDHLTGTALEDEDVTNADEVAGDGDGLGVAATTGLNNADILAESIPVAGRASLGDDDLLFLVGVDDALGNTLHATAEGVVVTLVVVVTHLASRGFFLHGRLDGSSLGGRGRVVGVPRGAGGDGVDLLAGVRSRAVRLDGRQGLVGAVVGVGVGVIPVLVFCLGLKAARIGDVKSAGLVVVEGVVDGGLVAGVVRDVDVVGRVGATTVLSLGDVELVGQSLVVNGGSFLAGNSSVGLAVTGEGVSPII